LHFAIWHDEIDLLLLWWKHWHFLLVKV